MEGGGKGYGAGLGGSETGEGWRAVQWHSSPDMGCDGIECRGGGAEVWYGGWTGGWTAQERKKSFGRLLCFD